VKFISKAKERNLIPFLECILLQKCEILFQKGVKICHSYSRVQIFHSFSIVGSITALLE